MRDIDPGISGKPKISLLIANYYCLNGPAVRGQAETGKGGYGGGREKEIMIAIIGFNGWRREGERRRRRE